MLNKCHFYTAWSSRPITIFSDCSGLKQYQLKDISDIDNKRMFNIKADIQNYNYEIKHVSGESNCIADCLSRRPAWLVGKDRTSDCNQDPLSGSDTGPRDELCMRVITEARHLLRANLLSQLLRKQGRRILIIK